MYMEGRMQLHLWEMQDVDEETKVFWAQLLDEDAKLQDSELSSDEHPSITDVDANEPMTSPPRDPTSPIGHGIRRSPLAMSTARNGFNRPPVFGPYEVTQDQRVKALHRQVMTEFVLVGVLSAMVRVLPSLLNSLLRHTQIFAAILIPIPSLKHAMSMHHS
jgi:hypothetical protein